MPYKLLLVDDDHEVLEVNAKYLSSQGFIVKLSTHPSVVLNIIKDFEPDCVVLDVMMPEMDGMTLCKKIRSVSAVPIIFLSGKTGEDDRINGLMLGADDYMIKPYSLRELAARIMTNIRRHTSVSAPSVLSFPPLSINTTSHKIYFNDEEITLSNREYELLLLLVNNKNNVVTFEDIAKQIWGVYSESDRRSIMVNASRLRKKLEQYPGLGQMIETVWSKGYKFIAKQ